MKTRASSRRWLSIGWMVTLLATIAPAGSAASAGQAVAEEATCDSPDIDDKCEAWAMAAAGEGDPGAGATQLVLGSGGDRIYLIGSRSVLAVDGAGNQLWSAPWVVAEDEGGALRSLALSPDESVVYATGYLYPTGDLASRRGKITAYATSTGERLWDFRDASGTAPSSYSDVAIGPDGNTVYATRQNSEPSELAIIAIDAQTGERKWEDGIPGAIGAGAGSIAAGPSGRHVYVAGSISGGSTRRDFLTIAYDAASGARAWTARYGEAGLDETLYKMVASPDGSRVFVTGRRITGEPAVPLVDGSEVERVTVAYDGATGAELWAKGWHTTTWGPRIQQHWGASAAMAVSPTGDRVYVSGQSSDPNLPRWGGPAATVAYDAATGVLLWVGTYRDPIDTAGTVSMGSYRVAVSPDGSQVYVAHGAPSATVIRRTGAEPVTVAYDSSTGRRLWVARYDHYPDDSSCCDAATDVVATPDGKRVYTRARLLGPQSWDMGLLAYDVDTGGAPVRTGVDTLSASVEDGAIQVTGTATFVGAQGFVGDDAWADSKTPAPGTDLTWASIERPPGSDGLTFTMALTDMPPTGGTAGYVYHWSLGVDGRDEGLMLEAAFGAVDCVTGEATAPIFRVVRDGFEEVARLQGSFAGSRVTFRDVPMQSIGASAGSMISSPREGVVSSTGIAGCVSYRNTGGDFMAVGDYVVPEETVQLGIAPAGTPVSDVPLTSAATLGAEGSSFSGSLGAPGKPGDYVVVARACYVPDVCGVKSMTVTV